MAETNRTQEEQINTEQQEEQQFNNSILKICEPMCINLIKEKPKNITSYMINWLKNKYNYSSSLLQNQEKKELQKLKDDIEIFHEMDEHFYFVEQQNKSKKETKTNAKKSKVPPKPKLSTSFFHFIFFLQFTHSFNLKEIFIQFFLLRSFDIITNDFLLFNSSIHFFFRVFNLGFNPLFIVTNRKKISI